MALSVLSLNVNGLRDPNKRVGLIQWLRSLPTVDVICLQETHYVSEAECHSWFVRSGFNSVVSPGSNHSCGCIVLYRPALNLVQLSCDIPGRSLFCHFTLRDVPFRVLTLYA